MVSFPITLIFILTPLRWLTRLQFAVLLLDLLAADTKEELIEPSKALYSVYKDKIGFAFQSNTL